MSKLSLKHVYKIYDNGTKAVNDFNLDIGDDEFIVFVGPSGCGKSTTLRMIAGLEDITAGDLFIDGVLSNALEPKDRDMAMVFQNYALYPHMTVYDNMAFGLRIRHIPKDEIDRRVNEAAKILDIADQLNKKPKAMSGGQRQRVALGRAIVRKPRVFLLDEPLSNLDAKLRSSMRSEITRLHNVLKTTFIYVTHDQIEAMTMGSKIVVMKTGVTQQVDTPMNLYDYPSNEFVAGFIGTPQMNFLKGKLSLEKNNLCIDLNGHKFICPLSILPKLDYLSAVQKKEVTLGIRPEHISLCEKCDKNAIECVIAVVEALGNESNLICDSLAGDIHLTMKTLRNDNLKVGDKVFISFNENKIHLFDKETTNTIMPRIPLLSSLSASILDNNLVFASGKVSLSSFVVNKLHSNKNVIVLLNNDAICEGHEIKAKIIKKENINNKWLFTLKVGEQFVHYYIDKYIDGDDFTFAIDLSKVDIYNADGDLLLSRLITENIVEGKLLPYKRKMPYLKTTPLGEQDIEEMNNKSEDKGANKVKYKTKNVFKYSLLGENFVPSLSATNKIYALLGKKFSLHSINFHLPVEKIILSTSEDDETFEAKVVEEISYGLTKFYIVRINELDIVISNLGSFAPGDMVSLSIKVDDIGVSDVNFGVKII